MERFIIVDFYDSYDCPEVIGRTNDEREANKIRDERYDDTDGEADVCIYDTKKVTSYLLVKDWILGTS